MALSGSFWLAVIRVSDLDSGADLVRVAAEIIAASLEGDEDTAVTLVADAKFRGDAVRVLFQVVNQLSSYCEAGAGLSDVLDEARRVALQAAVLVLEEDPDGQSRWRI